jgi:hypothetical protein
MPLIAPHTRLSTRERLRWFVGRFQRATLEVTRPQGPVALAGRTTLRVRASASGVLDVDGVRFVVVDGCDCDVVVDARARVTARYRGRVVVVDAVVVAAPAAFAVVVDVPAVDVVVDVPAVDVSAPAFFLPQPPRSP